MVDSEQSSLEGVWAHREDVIYPGLFGSKYKGIFVLDTEVFEKSFQQTEVDPRWLFCGVFEFEPIPSRNSWLYVTSGLSTPWHQEVAEYAGSEYSGLGTELVLESRLQEVWPIVILQRLLAFNLLLAHGRFGEDASALNYGDRIPLRSSISLGVPSALEHVVIGYPAHFAASFQLVSGQVDLLQIVGISESERDFAKSNSSDDLIRQLTHAGCYPVTDPSRLSIV